MSDTDLLNYRVVGDGHPVLFLHGFLESNRMWDNLTEDIAEKYKCIFIELPGHGQSIEFNAEPPSIEGMVEKVKRTLLHITSNAYSIVGHSLGGYVALSLVESHPNFSSKLVLLNSHPWEDSQSKKTERERVINVVEKSKELFIQTAIPNLYRNPNKQESNIKTLISDALQMTKTSIQDSLAAMKNRSDRTKVLEELKNDCLVIQGQYDHLIDADKMLSLTSELNTKFTSIQNAGHMAHHEAPKEVVREIKKFI